MEKEALHLILCVQAGDEEAFQILYQNYYNSVLFKAKTICHNEADAKDVVQDVFIEVHRSIKNLRDPNSFYSWLMMIVMSKCNDLYRKNKFVTTDIDAYQHHNSYIEERPYMDPTKSMENASERAILLQIIETLTPKQSQLARMMYLEEMKLSEIAKELDIPLGTVKTRSVRVRAELKRKIEAYEKQEGRKLHFHAELAIPFTLLSVLDPKTVISFLKSHVTQSVSFVKDHAVMSVCTASITALSVSAGVMVYQDQVQSHTPANQQVVMNSQKPAEEQVSAEESFFQSVFYDDILVHNSKEAYYICLNFARDEEGMQDRSKDEFLEIEEVYENLKSSNSPYYTKLVSQGWTSLFEQYKSEISI